MAPIMDDYSLSPAEFLSPPVNITSPSCMTLAIIFLDVETMVKVQRVTPTETMALLDYPLVGYFVNMSTLYEHQLELPVGEYRVLLTAEGSGVSLLLDHVSIQDGNCQSLGEYVIFSAGSVYILAASFSTLVIGSSGMSH